MQQLPQSFLLRLILSLSLILTVYFQPVLLMPQTDTSITKNVSKPDFVPCIDPPFSSLAAPPGALLTMVSLSGLSKVSILHCHSKILTAKCPLMLPNGFQNYEQYEIWSSLFIITTPGNSGEPHYVSFDPILTQVLSLICSSKWAWPLPRQLLECKF